jgi:hypothetical protein
MTRTRALFDEFRAEFVRVHTREPSVVEVASLRSVASLAARIAGNKLSATEVTRASNTMVKTLRCLGLANPAKPVKPPKPDGLAALNAAVARMRGEAS